MSLAADLTCSKSFSPNKPNPASASIDTLPTEDSAAHHQRRGPQGGRRGGARDSRHRARRGRHRGGASSAAAGCSTSAPAPAAGWACWTPPRCPPTFSVPPEMVQGIIAGGEAALSRATEATEDDPAAGARDLPARGFTAARRAGGHRRQRPHALRAGRRRRSPAPGRGHHGDQLHAGFRAGARGRISPSRRWSGRR